MAGVPVEREGRARLKVRTRSNTPHMSNANVGPAVSTPSIKNSALWGALRHLKHQLVLRFAKRENRVYTQFYRFPNQYTALIERVMPALRPGAIDANTPPLDIVIFACCTGAEAFSLSYVLQKNFPGLRFRIRGYDLVEEAIAQARTGVYDLEDVRQGDFMNEQLIGELFDAPEGGKLRVKAALAAPVSFDTGNLLDGAFTGSLGKVDMVFAQNVLFHLPRPKARIAFGHIYDVLKPSGAMFVNGMDTDMRVSLTKKLEMQPLDFLVEEIHNDARVNRGGGWASAYWGRQPFSRRSSEWLRKHGTIFFRTK